MTTGHALRDQGQDAAIAAECSVTRGYGDFIRDAIEMLAAVNDRPWTCDTVRRTAERLFRSSAMQSAASRSCVSRTPPAPAVHVEPPASVATSAHDTPAPPVPQVA